MTTTYRLAPRVQWVVDGFGLTVADGRGNVHKLQYPEAAVWDLFTRAYSFSDVVSMMTHIASLDPAAAEAMVRTSIEAWAQVGLFETTGHRVIAMRSV